MKACVTGGAGFIGSHLVDRLVADGNEVVVLDNLATGSRENLAQSRSRIQFHEGDVRDPVAVQRALRGVEVVYHLAALAAVQRSVEHPAEVAAVNVLGTVNVLVEAREEGVRRVVFASSSSVYGAAPDLPLRETMPVDPRSPYAASKAAAEAFLFSFQTTYGLEGVALRYFNVYGERQPPRSLYAAVIPRFLETIARGDRPVIYGDGHQTRDFTHVADVVDACVRAAGAPREATGCPINVGRGEQVSIRHLAATVGRVLDRAANPLFEPARPGESRHSVADVGRARDLMGWTPQVTLEDGLARTAAYLASPGAHGAAEHGRPARSRGDRPS
jgi:nucleoside-diphosphate-sugar epimerase